MIGSHRLAQSCILPLLLALTATAQNRPLEPGAYIAAVFTKVTTTGKEVKLIPYDAPVIIVTSRYYVKKEFVQPGKLIAIQDLTDGSAVTNLRVLETTADATVTNGPDVFGGFVVGGDLDPTHDYRVTLAHDKYEAWTSDGSSPVVAVASPKKVELDVKPLPPGKRVTNSGLLEDQPESAKTLRSVRDDSPLSWLTDNGHLTITPETAEDSRELGLKYDLDYSFGKGRFDLGAPGRLSLDADIEGRVTSDRSSAGFTGYSRGDLNLRLLLLPGRQRYYPIGLRVAAGYESDEDISNRAATGKAQFVLSLPYADDLLLAWHRTIGVNRAFAPPVLSFGAVYTDPVSTGTPSTGNNRWEFEAAWIAPVAERWDFSFRWRHYDFMDRGVGNEEFLEMGFTFYPDSDRGHGVTVNLEDGFRPLIGDVGSTLMLGYTIRAF